MPPSPLRPPRRLRVGAPATVPLLVLWRTCVEPVCCEREFFSLNSFSVADGTARSLAICSRSRRRVAACTHATPPLRPHHPLRSHGISVCMRRTRSPALAAALATAGSETALRPPSHSLPRSAGLDTSATWPAPARSRSRFVLSLLGSSLIDSERRPPLSCSFRCHVTSTPRGRDSRCCVGSLGHSVTTRCAEQQRRGAASHRRWPTAVPTEKMPSIPPQPSISPPPSSPRDRLRRARPALLAHAALSSAPSIKIAGCR